MIANKIARRTRRNNSIARVTRRTRRTSFNSHMTRAYVESQNNRVTRETMREIENDVLNALFANVN